jgi:hypothetical protein
MKKRKEREQENNQLNKRSMEPLNILIKKTQRLLLSTQKAELHSYLNHFFPIKNSSPHSKRKWQKLLQPILQNPF